MRGWWLALTCAGLVSAQDAEDAVSRMLSEKLTSAQRSDACHELRGNRSAPAVAAMRQALSSGALRACAGRNLREAGAVEELRSALADSDTDVRALAARELGAMRRPELIPLLDQAAFDPHPLVALNAVDALAGYQDRSVLPSLVRIAGKGQMAGVSAMKHAAQLGDPAILPVARQYLDGPDVAARVIAVGVIGEMGGASDLPRLREMAAKTEPLSQQGRGFGLMPAISLGQAARNAIERIEARRSKAQDTAY
ncbi:MAG: HEAT repeat domain-containing protein [Candidatus Solibacter usitatus]|nr:HEAT repeat domain-containing protein [Candidatus Solibacter usitatus]